MLRRLFLLSGLFFALLAVPALATQVTVVTPNPETGRLDGTTLLGGALYGTVNFAGPTFQLTDNAGKAMPGQTLRLYCTGAMACPLLAATAKTDQFGQASLQFARELWVFLPTIPPGVGAPIGRYTVWATWACPQDAQGNAAGCFTSPIVTLQAVCWGPFKQCVGSGTPAPVASATPAPKTTPGPAATTAPASTGPGLSLLDPSPVAVPLQKICAKNAPTV